jgi:hypothetical protein
LKIGTLEGRDFLVGVNKMVMRFTFSYLAFGLLLVKIRVLCHGLQLLQSCCIGERMYVYCAVRTGYFNVSYVNLSLQRLRDDMNY